MDGWVGEVGEVGVAGYRGRIVCLLFVVVVVGGGVGFRIDWKRLIRMGEKGRRRRIREAVFSKKLCNTIRLQNEKDEY